MTAFRSLKNATFASLTCAAFAALMSPTPAEAFSGVYYDHSGRSAIKVTPCGGGLCGRIVWLKNAAHSKACGTAIIGGGKRVGKSYDTGWIYNPENGRKYNVEVTKISASQLKVMGYAGSKMLSKTMVWRRAPSNLKPCSRTRSISVNKGNADLIDLNWGAFPQLGENEKKTN
ncbi:MAG: DUF2147 domain-containing protein [Hyphomicrobiaceae bacterium]|nr:DUF2147 domain-containing protein [Hyphomicrobiaceae bacterium]